MSNFNGTTLNAGSGGPILATSLFVNGSPAQSELMPWTALAYLASGNANDTTGVFQTVGPANGMPVSAAQAGAWSMTLLAGAALVGQFEISDGTNVLGTSAHPLVVSVNNTISLSGTSAVSMADGANATFGAEADAAAVSDTATATYMALVKRELQHLSALIAQLPAALSGAGNLKVAIEESVTTVTVSVSGTTAISGTVTANIGTTGGLALDATLTGGSSKAIARGGQKGTTNANADITHTASGLNHEALDVALYDASGNQLGTSGSPVRVDPTGTTTQPISGTLTANQGGAPWSFVGNVASGAADSGDPVKVGGVFNTALPTLTSGQRGDLQVDSSGRLIVNVGAGGGSGGTSSSFSAAFPATGTAAGASDGTNMKPLLVDASGNLKVNIVTGGGSGSNAAAGLTGSAVPADADYLGVNVGGTLRGAGGVSPTAGVYVLQVDLASLNGTALSSAIPVSIGSTVAVTQSGSWTVTANAGTGTFNNQQTNITADYDTGAGVQNLTMFGIALPGNGGAVAGGTSTNPIAVSIPNGATVNQGTPAGLTSAWTVSVTDGATTMPTGASSAHSIHTTIDNASLAVTQSGTWSLAANQSVNVAQIAGTTTSVNHGTVDAGTQRVAIAKDDGVSTHSRLSTADTNLVSVKTAAGRIRRIEAFNTGAGAAYLRIYNKASAPVIASDSALIIRRILIPGNAAGAGCFADYLEGIPFSTGLAYDITGANGDTDATALAANQVTLNIDYF